MSLEELKVKLHIYMEKNNFNSEEEALDHLQAILEKNNLGYQVYEVEREENV